MLEIQETKNKGVRFVIRSPEGSPLLESVDFSSRSEIRQCFRELRPRLGNPSCFERRTTHQGQFQFALKGPGGKTLGFSAPYRSEAGMENGIRTTLAGLRQAPLP